MLATSPAYCGMKSCGGVPRKPTRVVSRPGASTAAASRTARPKRTGTRAIASANTSSAFGEAGTVDAGMGPGVCWAGAGSIPVKRSGSARIMSKPTIPAPRPARRVVRSASRSRGHGHCPIRVRLSSSISTITMSLDRVPLDRTCCSTSKDRSRRLATGSGSHTLIANRHTTRMSTIAWPRRRFLIARFAFRSSSGDRKRLSWGDAVVSRLSVRRADKP